MSASSVAVSSPAEAPPEVRIDASDAVRPTGNWTLLDRLVAAVDLLAGWLGDWIAQPAGTH